MRNDTITEGNGKMRVSTHGERGNDATKGSEIKTETHLTRKEENGSRGSTEVVE
jgi:hypothetical protein